MHNNSDRSKRFTHLLAACVDVLVAGLHCDTAKTCTARRRPFLTMHICIACKTVSTNNRYQHATANNSPTQLDPISLRPLRPQTESRRLLFDDNCAAVLRYRPCEFEWKMR